MLFSLLCSLVFSAPAEPLSILADMKEKDLATVESTFLKKGFRFARVIKSQPGIFARSLMDTPSLLAMLNRQGIEHNLVEDFVEGDATLYVAERYGTRIALVFREQTLQMLMFAFPKRVIYPIRNPFSGERNDVLNDSIGFLGKGCKSFDLHLQSGSRQWKGEKCSFGKVRIEWEPTTDYWMRVLLYSAPE